ncbi:type II toxin-antitoxin system mRNA interferase toxin, RelE/StbE family [Candidatus Woesearchaeota archaeon]|nr:type II toxin-antitoxin system mRNA interferase toxin, RelE/StbE family [Candidatus Woesearchaeota archaeon]
MAYAIEIHPKCQKEITRLSKKNGVLEEALKKKMAEILENPQHYKPLKGDLAGERRVHIMKSFVLKFEISEPTKTVKFLSFAHHDEAYRR